MKKRMSLIAALLLAASLTAGIGYAAVKCMAIKNNDDQSIQILQQQITSNTKSGYVALKDIKAGEVLTDSMVQFTTTMISDVDQSMFMNSEDIGKAASSSITAGMPIYKEDISPEEPDALRERECSFIWLSSNLKDYDFVDVRIMFPNGEDYIVAAKKAIYDTRISVNDVFLRLTEEEIQLLDSAIVDANMHDAKIYVTKYTNPTIQEASEVSYSPSSDVMRVIASDPNIVETSAAALSVDARAAMDKRLKLFEEAYPDFSITEEIGSNSRYDEAFFNPESEVTQ